MSSSPISASLARSESRRRGLVVILAVFMTVASMPAAFANRNDAAEDAGDGKVHVPAEPSVLARATAPEVSTLATECPASIGFDLAATTSYGYVACTYAAEMRAPDGESVVTDLFMGDDEVSGAIDLPFGFPYYGTTYDSLVVSSNGFISFDPSVDDGCCDGELMPDPFLDDDVWSNIAAFWTDLYPPDGGTIRTFDVGSGLSEEFVIEFAGVPHIDDISATQDFQIVLHPDGDFEIVLDDVNLADEYVATTGWQDCNGSDGATLLELFDVDSASGDAWYVHAPATPGVWVCATPFDYFCDFASASCPWTSSGEGTATLDGSALHVDATAGETTVTFDPPASPYEFDVETSFDIMENTTVGALTFASGDQSFSWAADSVPTFSDGNVDSVGEPLAFAPAVLYFGASGVDEFAYGELCTTGCAAASIDLPAVSGPFVFTVPEGWVVHISYFAVSGFDLPNADADEDGTDNFADTCALVPDPDQTDTDGDAAGDACDQDDDDDDLRDSEEAVLGTDPLNDDSDDDGLGDGFEIELQDEFGLTTCPDPLNDDSDGDEINDSSDYFDGGVCAIGVDDDLDGEDAFTDCDDEDDTVYHGAFELPDGLDNDCNDLIDDFTSAIIDNGVVQLGIYDEGHLNVFDGSEDSTGGTFPTGLRHVPTGFEATAPGCVCEGWGIADSLTSTAGYANADYYDDVGVNMEVESFTATPSTAVSTVLVGDPPIFRVTHDYHPAEETDNLYEVTVTVENIGEDPTNVLYRRVMDWDVEPTPFDEFTTLQRGTATNLVYMSNDGFADSNPLDGPSHLGVDNVNVEDAGPDDHGALFDFDFGELPAGETLVFQTYYGAAASEDEALDALFAVGTQAFSLGQANLDACDFDYFGAPEVLPDCSAEAGVNGPLWGGPTTFMFAFAGIGGTPYVPTAPRLFEFDVPSAGPGDTVGVSGTRLSFISEAALLACSEEPDLTAIATTGGSDECETTGDPIAVDFFVTSDNTMTFDVPAELTEGLYVFGVGSPDGGDSLCCLLVGTDTDGDFLLDSFEDILGSDPLVADTDGDGIDDGIEWFVGFTDLLDPDSDDDNMTDGDEFEDPVNGVDDVCPWSDDPDYDEDGILDGDDEEPCQAFSETQVDVLVTDDEETPIDDAFVSLYPDWLHFDGEAYDEDATDSAGEVSFFDLPRGHFIVSTCVDGLGCAAQSFFSTGQPTTMVSIPADEDEALTGEYTAETDLLTLVIDPDGFEYRPPPLGEQCGGVFSGFVLTEDGDPVPDVPVSVWTYDVVDTGSGYGYAQTDAEGAFVIAGLGDGTYDSYLGASVAGFQDIYTSEGFTIDGSDPEACGETATPALIDAFAYGLAVYESDEDGNDLFYVSDGLTLAGTVYDDDGNALESAFVYVGTRYAVDPDTGDLLSDVFSWGYATTDADGEFEVAGLTAIGDDDDRTGFDIYVYPPDGRFDLNYVQIAFPDDPVQGDEDTGSPLNPLDVEDERLDFVLQGSSVLEGSVLTDDGDAVPSAWISVWPDDWEVGTWGGTVSEEDGAYQILGLATDPTDGVDYSAGVWPQWESGVSAGFFDFTLFGDTDMDFVLESGVVLSGCIVDDDGNEVVGAWLSAWNDVNGGWAATGDDGCFELFGLTDGTYSVYVYPPWSSELVPLRLDGLDLDTASPGFDADRLTETDSGFLLHDVDEETILLTGGSGIIGCLETDGGDPIPNAWIGAWSGLTGTWGGDVSGDGTDRDYDGTVEASEAPGCFRVPNLVAAEDYFVDIWPPYDLGVTNVRFDGVEVVAGDDTDLGVIVMDDGHHIIGDIVDEDGNPIAGVEVCAWREDHGAFGWTYTDENGHFDIRGLPGPGDADVEQGWFLWLGVPPGYIARNYPMDKYSGSISPFDAESADNEDTEQADAPTGESTAVRGLVVGVTGRLVITMDDADNGDRDGDPTTTTVDSNYDVANGGADVESVIGDDDFEPIVLDSGESLPGFVKDADGTPMPDVQIWGWGEAGWGYAVTDSDGAFTMNGLAEGDLDLWVYTADGRSKYETGSGADDVGCQVGDFGDNDAGDIDTETPPTGATGDDGCVIEFETPGSFHIKVDSGPTDSGVYVQLSGPGYAFGHTGADGQTEDSTGDGDSYDDTDSVPGTETILDGPRTYGELLISGLAPGEYTLRLLLPGCLPVFDATITIVGGETTEKVVNLAAANAVEFEGDVTDGTDPLPGVLVIATFDELASNFDVNGDGVILGVTTFTTATDENGHYRFIDGDADGDGVDDGNALPVGTYTILAVGGETQLGVDIVDAFTLVLDTSDDDAADGGDADGVFDADTDSIADAAEDLVLTGVI